MTSSSQPFGFSMACTCQNDPEAKSLLVRNPQCPVHGLAQEAAGNLSFLLSVIRSGGRLTEDQEKNVQRLIVKLTESGLGHRLQPGAQRFDSELQAQEFAADRAREMWAVRYYPEPRITGKWIVHWWSA
jgi:hypothetical protein